MKIGILVLLSLLLTGIALAQPKSFLDQRQPAAQKALQAHFRAKVDEYIKRNQGFEFAAHRCLGDPKLLHGYLPTPDGQDNPYEIFVGDGNWERRSWRTERVAGHLTRIYGNWEQTNNTQFCDGITDGHRGWEIRSAANGNISLTNDYILARQQLGSDQTCWHESLHAALFRGNATAAPAPPDGDHHHTYIEYSEKAVEVMNQLTALEQAMQAVPATKTPQEEQQAWVPIHQSWRRFVKQWANLPQTAGVPPWTPAMRQELRNCTGIWFEEPSELAQAYARGRCMGKTLARKPPAWVFAEGGDLRTNIPILAAVPDGPYGDRWRLQVDITSPQGTFSRGRPDRGTLTLTLDDSEPLATWDVTGDRDALKLANGLAAQAPWNFDLSAGASLGAEGLRVYLQVDDLAKATGRDLHFTAKYSGFQDPKDPEHNYTPCQARFTVPVRKLVRLQVKAPDRVTPDGPLLLQVEATDEKGKTLTLDPARKPAFVWSIFARNDYEGERVEIGPRPAGVIDLMVALYAQILGKERLMAETTHRLTVEAKTAVDLKGQAESTYQRLQKMGEWIDEVLALDQEAMRLVEKQCTANHARQLKLKYADKYTKADAVSPEGAANLLAEDILEEQRRLRCTQRPGDEHRQHQADLKATREALDASRLGAGAFKEYSGLGDYAGYLKAVKALEQGFKVKVPDPITRPASLPWSYGLACGGDVGGVARAVKVKLSAPKTTLKPGEILPLTAEASGGVGPYQFTWSPDPAATGPTYSFSTQKPGAYDLTATATDSAGKTDKATLRVLVANISATVQVISGPSSVPVGGKLGLRVQVTQDGKPAPGDFTFRWQPNPEVSWDRLDSKEPKVTATFPRPGQLDLWVQVLQDGRTVTESAPLTVKVVPPQLSLSVTPPQPRLGQQARATLRVSPDSAAVDIRFQPLPAWATLVKESPREILFYLKETRPAELVATARTPHYGDDLGEARHNVTALPYQVKVSAPQGQLATGQRLALQASLTPTPDHPPLRYRWTAPEGCSLSNPASQQPTLTCSQLGNFDLTVEVSDAHDVVLGRGSARVAITQGGADPSKGKQALQLAAEGKVKEAAQMALQSGDPKIVAQLAATLKKLAWEAGQRQEFGTARQALQAALLLNPNDEEAKKKLAQIDRAEKVWPQVQSLGQQVDELVKQRRLVTAYPLLSEMIRLANDLIYQGADMHPYAHGVNQRYLARLAEWNKFYQDTADANRERFRTHDYQAVLGTIPGLESWELNPANRASVDNLRQNTERELARQNQAWKTYGDLKSRFDSQQLSRPQVVSGVEELRSALTHFGAQDPRHPQILQLLGQLQASLKVVPLQINLNPSEQRCQAGQEVSTRVQVSGGAPPYRYQWLDEGRPTEGDQASRTWRYSNPGRYQVTVVVRDANQQEGRATCVLLVAPAPSIQLRMEPTQTNGRVNEDVQIAVQVSGGVPPYRYQWADNDQAMNTPGPSNNWKFPVPGRHLVTVLVRDAGNQEARATCLVMVEARPSIQVRMEPTQANGRVNQNVQIAVHVSGGAPPYRYQWFSNDQSIGAQGPSNAWKFPTAGRHLVTVLVKDAANQEARATCVVMVEAQPAAVQTPPVASPSGGSGVDRTSWGSSYAPNTKGNPFQGGTWCNSRNGSDWLQRDFASPRRVREIHIDMAGTDVSTDGSVIEILLHSSGGNWVLVDRLENTNINWEQLSGGRRGRSIPPYRKVLASPIEADAIRIQFTGNGWFVARNIQVVTASADRPPTPPAAPGGVEVLATFTNESTQNVHIFAQGDDFGPHNRLAPGQERQVRLRMGSDGRIRFVCGRNGQVLASTTWNGDPDNPNRYPRVKFTRQETLVVLTGLR